jgi:CBS domain-containing protein
LKAATVMAEAGIGFLPICDAHMRVIGVVTDRDLATRVLAKKIAPETCVVIMTGYAGVPDAVRAHDPPVRT